ncbi:unnamed protein product [Parnassius apollo]|uniref:(apollo) hypothetical protein n=1 Tax=Parnassius apollo TaxID=110799 RepID=A0A8S3W5Z9_PARAO|nr:unnamed protein product [Parnassius apollo]
MSTISLSQNAEVRPAKRKNEDILVDPNTNVVIENAKKPKIELNAERKFKCIPAIVAMYHAILNIAFGEKNANETKSTNTNLVQKRKETSFKIHYLAKDYTLTNDTIHETWKGILTNLGLEYKDFQEGGEANWYGTMGPYLDMFSSYVLRYNELRLGHDTMPITKVDGVHKSFPVTKYRLSGAHDVLLEGSTFPPERRSSIIQSLGPMTAWICMIRSEGKYAAAVREQRPMCPA